MRNDPVEEWRRLTEYYRSLTDDQLDELATEFADLTETARQILRAEVRSRGLPDPQAPHAAVNGNHASPLQPDLIFNAQEARNAQKVRDAQKAGQAPSSAGDPRQEADLPHEYTWKTLLCTCNTRAEAWQISEMLRRAGIENWMDGPGVYSPHAALDLTDPRVLVAADELDRARVIASMPIPQEVIDESNVTVPDFELPAPDAGLRTRCSRARIPPIFGAANLAGDGGPIRKTDRRKCLQPAHHGRTSPGNGKSRPATGQLFLGRIVPTEAKP